MSQTFTRKELYDLVWSEPMKNLCKQFELSDVGLAKACKRSNIPRPPRGYWAKRAAGKKVTQTDLPKRGPGMSDTVTIGAQNYYHTRSDHGLLNEEIGPPPSFDESIEQVRLDAERLVGKATVPKTLQKPHRAIASLLAKDIERKRKQMERDFPWRWDEPLFESSFEKRRLRFLSGIFIASSRLGFSPMVRGKTAGDLDIHIGDQSVSFTLDTPKRREQRGYEREVVNEKGAALKLEIEAWAQPGDIKLVWQDSSEHKVESDITEILVTMVVVAEIQYRCGLLRNHEWRKQRKAELEEAERKRIAEEKERARQEKLRLEKARIDKLIQDADNMLRAEKIRDYVSKVGQQNTIGTTEHSREALKEWTEWALSEADRIDPVTSGEFISQLSSDFEDAKSEGS